jgi:hypothetical protein
MSFAPLVVILQKVSSPGGSARQRMAQIGARLLDASFEIGERLRRGDLDLTSGLRLRDRWSFVQVALFDTALPDSRYRALTCWFPQGSSFDDAQRMSMAH